MTMYHGLTATGRALVRTATRTRAALTIGLLTVGAVLFGPATPALAGPPSPGGPTTSKTPFFRDVSTPDALSELPWGWIGFAVAGAVLAIILHLRYKRNHPGS